VVFSPKRELYYLLEEKLKDNSIVVYEESIDDGFFSLSVKDAKLSYSGLDVATIGELNISSFLFYSIVTIYDVSLSDIVKPFAPIKTLNIKISHNIFSFNSLSLTAQLDDILKEVKIRMIDNKIRVEMSDINGTKYLAPFMKKGEKGWYYEKNI
jgi:hypothetical protein